MNVRWNLDEIPRTVEVLGLPDDIDQDDLYGYFENRRFGGGQIENLHQHSGSEGSTLITFKDKTGDAPMLSLSPLTTSTPMCCLGC